MIVGILGVGVCLRHRRGRGGGKNSKPNFTLHTPSHVPIYTSKTLELRMKKLPQKARKAFRVDDVPHNMVTVATLVDAGCSVDMYYWGFEVDYNEERIYKRWREQKSKLFKKFNRLVILLLSDELITCHG